MNYDTYSRYIYQWLIDNDIADKIDTLVDSVEKLVSYFLVFGLTYVMFKFLNKRWLSV